MSQPQQDPRIVLVNGEIHSAKSAQISIFDRGFIYGDSLYEVFRTYGGKIFQLSEHLGRLATSARLAHMKIDQSPSELQQALQSALDAFHQKNGDPRADAYVRLIVTRGLGSIGMGLKHLESPSQVIVVIQPLQLPTEEQFENGLKLQISSRIRNHPRAIDPAMKSGNYLNNVLAVIEAHQAGYEDCLLCNDEGYLTEGSTFNIFYIRREIVATPPLSVGILDGITRRNVMNLLRENGYEVREVLFNADQLKKADEAFATSTLKDVLAITQIDSQRIANGKIGPQTRKIRTLYKQWLQREYP